MRIVTNKSVEKFLQLAQSRHEPSGSFTYGNTTITTERHPVNNSVVVYMRLHGNAIARAAWTGPTLHAVEFTLAGYPTVTTKEHINGLLWRLNAGCGVSTKDFQPRLHYRTTLFDEIREGIGLLDSTKWYKLVRHAAGGYTIDFSTLDPQDQEHICQSIRSDNNAELVEA